MENIVKLLHKEAYDVLFYTGIACKNQEIIDIFENTQLAFYDVTSGRIHITEFLIDYCIESTPKIHKFPVLPHSFGGGGIAAFIRQGDDYVFPHLDTHIAEVFRIAEEFNIPFMFKPACYNNRLEDAKQIDVMKSYYSGYIYTRVETYEGINRAIQENEENGNICTTHSILNSPLSFIDDERNFDVFKGCVRNNLSVYLTTMPISCFTGPATMYALILLGYSEFLVGLCLAQLLNPGVTVVNGAFPSAGDPSQMYQPALGTIFHNQCNYMLQRLSDYIALPSCQSGCTTGNKIHTPNPNYGGTDKDTYNGYKLWNKLSDWHQLRHSFGFIDNLIAFDTNKMRRDCVALDKVIENNEQYNEEELEEMSYDPNAEDAIEKGVEFGNFKDLDHTILNIGVLKEYLEDEEE